MLFMFFLFQHRNFVSRHQGLGSGTSASNKQRIRLSNKLLEIQMQKEREKCVHTDKDDQVEGLCKGPRGFLSDCM